MQRETEITYKITPVLQFLQRLTSPRRIDCGFVLWIHDAFLEVLHQYLWLSRPRMKTGIGLGGGIPFLDSVLELQGQFEG